MSEAFIEQDDRFLPCPFCGTTPHFGQTGKDQLTVRCGGCSVMYKQRWFRYGKEWLEAKMIEKWNTRTPPLERLK